MKAIRRQERPGHRGRLAVTAPSPRADVLLSAARAAATRAYCPYSRFAVGAALLADDGRIFTGANVENASYGLTICAERAALFAAVNAGVRRFRALAVVARTPATPCGACRQVLAEFCDSRLPVFCGTRTGTRAKRFTLGALLPQAFQGGRGLGGQPGCTRNAIDRLKKESQ